MTTIIKTLLTMALLTTSVTSNKSSLLLKIDLQNTQTLQLNYLKKYLRGQAKRLGLDRQSI
jgi:hypothetical protein